jgi:hypothetical protein
MTASIQLQKNTSHDLKGFCQDWLPVNCKSWSNSDFDPDPDPDSDSDSDSTASYDLRVSRRHELVVRQSPVGKDVSGELCNPLPGSGYWIQEDLACAVVRSRVLELSTAL